MQYLTPSQCRAARALLDWKQPDLAKKSDTHIQTICGFENESSTPTKRTLEKIMMAFDAAGIEFTTYDGIRKKPSGLRIYKGTEGFHNFYDDHYEVAKKIGGELWLYNGVSELFIKTLGKERIKKQKERMLKIKNRFHYRILLEEGDTTMFGSAYAHYRWIPKDQFNDKTIFVYGPYTAFVNFDNELTVTVIEQQEISDTLRQLMENSWDRAREPDQQPSV